eukprot:5930237-Ditylum_brightwellii.AAC.1
MWGHHHPVGGEDKGKGHHHFRSVRLRGRISRSSSDSSDSSDFSGSSDPSDFSGSSDSTEYSDPNDPFLDLTDLESWEPLSVGNSTLGDTRAITVDEIIPIEDEEEELTLADLFSYIWEPIDDEDEDIPEVAVAELPDDENMGQDEDAMVDLMQEEYDGILLID